MKQLVRSIVIVVLTTLVAGSALSGKKARKLPLDAYIKSAKIDIISGELDRYPEAIAMLDSLFMHYGPHAEALHWMGQINVDYIEKSASPMEKKPHIDKMVAYFDSLHQCCDNEEIKKKYRKNCKNYIKHADSITVKYWREFYNAGVEQLTVMNEISDEIELAEDSASRSYLEANLQANMDSCVANLELAITIDPTNHQTYIGIGSAYEKAGNHDKALEWQEIGLEKSPDSVKASMSLSIGYTYINMDRYCDAIPHLKNYLADSTTDTTWMYNLSICYNNCGYYDSALAIYSAILQISPNHDKVLSGVGRYHNELARRYSDSANFYSDKGDESLKQEWLARKDEAFDSSYTYYKRAFKSNPDDEFVADQFALIAALTERFEDAAEGYARIAELRPTDPDNWTYLGDVSVSLKRFTEAIAAYEKAVEFQPDEADLWQQLADLYQNEGMNKKEAEARAKLKALK